MREDKFGSQNLDLFLLKNNNGIFLENEFYNSPLCDAILDLQNILRSKFVAFFYRYHFK